MAQFYLAWLLSLTKQRARYELSSQAKLEIVFVSYFFQVISNHGRFKFERIHNTKEQIYILRKSGET